MPDVKDHPTIDAGMLIGGEQVFTDDRLAVRNPANPDDTVGVIGLAGPDHAMAAIAAAKAAQRDWAGLSAQDRGRIIAPALDRLGELAGTLARLYARENGRTLKEAEVELASIAPAHMQTLTWATDLDRGAQLERGSGYSRLRYRPFGVVVSIVPWNAPAALAFLHVVPALLAGNAIVVKPPETCPLTLTRLLNVFAETLPAGLVNVVTGLPETIGPTLTTHADVGKIAFTGGAASAAKITALSAPTIKSFTLELGGNDPAILLPGTAPDAAMLASLRRAVFMNTAQVCMAVKRIYVHEADAPDFIRDFSESVDALIVGDGLRPEVTMGPLHSRRQLDRVGGFVADAQARGATVRTLGGIDQEDDFARGYFMRPAVVTEIADDAPLMVEEQFGPAIPITTYRDLDDAILRANDTTFGLCASVWGQDAAQAADAAIRLEAGAVFVNGHGVPNVDRRLPYGGLKRSGQGRKAALAGILEYCQSQVLTIVA